MRENSGTLRPTLSCDPEEVTCSEQVSPFDSSPDSQRRIRRNPFSVEGLRGCPFARKHRRGCLRLWVLLEASSAPNLLLITYVTLDGPIDLSMCQDPHP